MTWRRPRLCARSARQGPPASPEHWSGGSTGESGAASSSCAARSCRESDRGGVHARRMWLPSSQREIVVRGNEQPPGASRTGTSDGAPARSPRASQAAATGVAGAQRRAGRPPGAARDCREHRRADPGSRARCSDRLRDLAVEAEFGPQPPFDADSPQNASHQVKRAAGKIFAASASPATALQVPPFHAAQAGRALFNLGFPCRPPSAKSSQG
jgi:hypothetical protein